MAWRLISDPPDTTTPIRVLGVLDPEDAGDPTRLHVFVEFNPLAHPHWRIEGYGWRTKPAAWDFLPDPPHPKTSDFPE